MAGGHRARRSLYGNNGYIYAQIEPGETRRTGPNGESLIDLRWTIREGSPATINKINIVGNDVTHERVIREAILIVPGELFNRDRLIRSYQNVSNLDFFEQPMAPPDVQPTENGVDVDITFRVEEKRTGNINFGASLGQGTGLGGFIGLEEPNLFGRGKRGRLPWQFGRNINDFNLSYTDPAIRESRISGTVTLFNSRQQYTVGDLGRRKQVGGSVQIGLPLLGSRYTRLYTSYGLQKISYNGGSRDLQAQYSCSDCIRSTLGLSGPRHADRTPLCDRGRLYHYQRRIQRRVARRHRRLPQVRLRRTVLRPARTVGRRRTARQRHPARAGAEGSYRLRFRGCRPVLYRTLLHGWRAVRPAPEGIRGILDHPERVRPVAGGGSAAGAGSFGESFALFTGEAGARVSQSLYFNVFVDAGNVYRTAQQYDPRRLFRSVGVGAAVLSPLGPIGIDLGYGLDKVNFRGQNNPGWKLHFRLGNFF